MSGVFLPSTMCLNAAMRWRGCTSWPPRPKIAVVSDGVLAIAGMPACCGRSAFARALKSDWVTSAGQGGLVGALENHDGLGRRERLDEFGLGERLEGLDRDDAHLDALRAQVGEQGAHVVGDRAEADHDVVGVLAVVRHDGLVVAAREGGVLVHRLADDSWNRAREVRAVVDGARLEVGLVLHGSGDAGVVKVDEGGNAAAWCPSRRS